MKLAKIKGKGNFLELEMKGAEDWYANVLRRLMINEVPTMAIELVEVIENDSILYDEIVAHRMGLIPLTTDLKSYVVASKEETETREFLAQSSCKLTIEAKGPCTVYAKDLVSTDPKVKPVYPDMPITKLLEGQKLKIVATAVLGVGRVHSKWAAGHVYYKKTGGDADAKTHDFEFHIESWGQLKPEEIVETSIDVYNKQLKEFDALLSEK